MIVITICSVIGGANSWVEVEEYGKAKDEWLKKLLELPSGIPSHDTFGRLFALLSTEELEKGFQRWVQSVAGALFSSGLVGARFFCALHPYAFDEHGKAFPSYPVV